MLLNTELKWHLNQCPSNLFSQALILLSLFPILLVIQGECPQIYLQREAIHSAAALKGKFILLSTLAMLIN